MGALGRRTVIQEDGLGKLYKKDKFEIELTIKSGEKKQQEQETGGTWKRKNVYTRTKNARRGDERQREA